jgi:hypothetical protein
MSICHSRSKHRRRWQQSMNHQLEVPEVTYPQRLHNGPEVTAEDYTTSINK